MYKTVCDPSLLFISEDEWQDEEIRDRFLSLFLGHLREVDRYKVTQFYWTHELEARLWTYPQSPPWRMDRDWKIRIVPIIARLFRTNQILVEGCEGFTVCKVQPGLAWHPSVSEAAQCFLSLMHYLISVEEAVFLCVGVKNYAVGAAGYRFSCECHGGTLSPGIIRATADWLNHIDPDVDLWPTNRDDVSRFQQAVEVMAAKKWGKSSRDFHSQLEVAPECMEDLLEEDANRKELLSAVAKRLTKPQAEATRDKGLKDEPVRGQKGLRRFRVTKSARIHYRYPGSETIRLLRYFGEGEHDAGL